MAINITSMTTSGQTDPNTSTPQVYAGSSLTFTVNATATGNAGISYLWQVSSNGGVTWFDLPNNGLSSITVTNWSVTQNGTVVRVQLSANSGPGQSLETVYSNELGFSKTITVLQLPTIVVTDYNQPSYIVATGSSLTLRVDATISSNLSQFSNTNSTNIDTELVMQWQYSTDNGLNWINVISSGSITVTTTLAAYGTTPETYYKESQLIFSNISFSINNYRYRCLISYTKDGTTAQNSPLASDSSSITVNPQIVVTKQPGVSPDTTAPVISYSASISGSGRATYSIVAFSTSSSSVSYQWSYTLDEGITYTDFPSSNPIFSGGDQVLFQMLGGTNPFGPILELDRLTIRNSTTQSSRYGFRVRITGTSGETAVVSDTAYVTLSQSATGLFENPVDQFVIEDKYGPVTDRSSYPEALQTATFSASVNLNAPDGLRGSPITLQWQRKNFGSNNWIDVGPAKVTAGTNSVSGGSLNPNNPGVYDHTTPPLRRDTDHQSQYRLSCTYPIGGGNFTTTFSSVATLNVYRTAYVDAPPTGTSSYVNAGATFAVIASPSSGSNISYQWQESSNGTNWFNINNTASISISSITRTNYTANVICGSSHGFVAGDIIYITGSTDIAYNGRFTVLSSGLTATTFQYTTYSIPQVSPAPGVLTVSKAPVFTGATTASLNILPVVETMQRRLYRCVITVPDSLSSVITDVALLSFLNDSFYQINSLNDITGFQFSTVSWTVTANSLSLRSPYYQWQKNTVSNSVTSTSWVDISGANSSTFEIVNLQPSDAAFYRCKVTSAGGNVSQSNAVRLRIIPVSITIRQNIQTSITVLEGSTTTQFAVDAVSSSGSIVQYQWQIKPPGSSTFVTAPSGYNQTSSTFSLYNLQPPSRTVNSGSVIRCAMTADGIPGIFYSNECTITVDRRFYYFADAATKTISSGQELILDLIPSYTGDDDPVYQWQYRTNSSGAWINISGETNPSYTILSNLVNSSINGYQYRCLVTLNQVTTFQYNRNSTTTVQPISPAGIQTATQIITLNVTTSVPNVRFYSKERQKVGAAIGTVICVPKPAGYIHDASANTDDVTGWKIALTGQTTTGTPVAGVSAGTRPYGPNDRFPGFIEMRGQILKARDFPELARIIGTTYGGNITGTYPLYNTNDTFRLPCPYGMKLMGLGNVDNNRSSPSVIPEYGPNSLPGGSITQAGSMGGVYNFEKLPQLPPGSPGDGSGGDGTSDDTFTIGVHRTDGWENCTETVATTFRGNFTWTVGGTTGMSARSISPPVHAHVVNSVAATEEKKGNGGGGNAARINYDEGGNVYDGPAFVSPRGRAHQHGLGFEAGNVVYTPPSGGGSGGAVGDANFSNPGGSFTLPSNVNSFSYNLTGGAGGGGGRDTNPGAPGGAGASASGQIINIPPGTTIGVKVGLGGGGGSGCASNATGGTGGNSGGTGFGGGSGGSSGGNGCSGSGGGGGGTTFMYIESLGSGANPAGLQRGDILVIIGGGGGGGGGGHHGGSQSTIYPGQDSAASWASSTINSSEFYDNQANLDFRDYDGNGATLQSGRTGQSRNEAGGSNDGGGGGGGGGGYRGGSRGTVRTGCSNGDCNANGGSAGTSAYRSSVHQGTPSISTGGTRGGDQGVSGQSGTATISYAGSTTVPPSNPGGTNSADHGEGVGTVGSLSLTQTVDIHNDPTSSSPSMGVEITEGTVVMSTRSRSAWDSAHSFYLRNNEVLPMIQPYFRLKYLIKAF
jgi:hypothetical protein